MELLFVFPLVMGISALFGYAILQPTATAASGAALSSTFSLVDLFTLSVLLSMPLAFYSVVRREYLGPALGGDIGAVLLCGVFAYCWWRGTSTLSRIGISNGPRRFVYLGFLMPLALIGSAIGVPLLIGLTFTLPVASPKWKAIWFGGLVATPIVAWCGRRLSFWVLSGVRTPAASGTPADPPSVEPD